MYETAPTSKPLACWAGRPLAGALFDLDGTLFDTVEDIAAALNTSIQIKGWRPFSDQEVKGMIGRGSPILIERAAAALGHSIDADAAALLLQRFFDAYEELEHSGRSRARPYEGAESCLKCFHQAGLKTAIVTNKHHRFAAALIERVGFTPWVDLIVGGDTCERRKPDPQPLLFACESLHVSHLDCLMIGDSSNDVQAARGAGIPVVCVSYGYNEGRDPRTLGCDKLIDALADLRPLVFEATSVR